MHLFSRQLKPRRTITIGLVLTVSALVITAGPVSAAYPPWYESRAKCYYEADATGERVLVGIVVTPPSLYADLANPMVGWRFVVRRSLNWDVGPWKIRYRSPIQASTSPYSDEFSPMSVGVKVPLIDDLSAVRYHVTMKVLWYAPDGSVSNRARHRFTELKWFANGNLQGMDSYCPASLDTGP